MFRALDGAWRANGFAAVPLDRFAAVRRSSASDAVLRVLAVRGAHGDDPLPELPDLRAWVRWVCDRSLWIALHERGGDGYAVGLLEPGEHELGVELDRVGPGGELEGKSVFPCPFLKRIRGAFVRRFRFVDGNCNQSAGMPRTPNASQRSGPAKPHELLGCRME